MVALAFPASPVNGQTYVGPNGVTYTFHGDHWHTGAEGASAFSRVWIGDTPPEAPVEGVFWWNSAEGVLYLRYDSAGTLTWVPANIGIAPLVRGREIFIQNQTVAASTYPTAIDWSLSGLGFSRYLLVLDDVQPIVSVGTSITLECQLGVGSPVTWMTGAYSGIITRATGTTAVVTSYTNAMPLSSTGTIASGGSYRLNGEVRFFNMLDTGLSGISHGGPTMLGHVIHPASDAINAPFASASLASTYPSALDVTALRIRYTTGLFLQGSSFTLYGVSE
jgi:hypothetical protein